LFRNDTENGNHWLRLRLIGRKANASAIGCRITVTRGNRVWVREVQGGKGTTSQHSLVQHFGLGQSAQPVSIRVRFAGRDAAPVDNVAPDRLIVVTEPEP
ncbi:CRTAC1 family protein, partial [candidate division WOR-3 bacterium]|nr:CRTAC1 family protein [candidate division WOR-3 bacterium]